MAGVSRPSRIFSRCSHSPPGGLFELGYARAEHGHQAFLPSQLHPPQVAPPSAGGTGGPRGSHVEQAPPHPPTGPAPTPRARPAPRNIALAPRRLAPRAVSRLPLAERSIAPSQPTARCTLSLVRSGVGGGVRSRGGARSEPRPLVPRLGRARRVAEARGAGLRAVRAVVTRVTVREGCWGPGCPASLPNSDGRFPETAIHPRGRQVAVGQVPGRDFGAD